MNNLLTHKFLGTREEWLFSGVGLLQDRVFKQADLEIPIDVKVACGFPNFKLPVETLAVCWNIFPNTRKDPYSAI